MTAPLHHLLGRWPDDPGYRHALTEGGDGLHLPDAVRPYFLAGLAWGLEDCVLAVVASDAQAEALAAGVREFLEPVAELPGWDVLPYEGLAPDPRISARRIHALHLLRHGSGPRVVVASVRGLIAKPAPGSAELLPLRLAAGSTVDRDALVSRLAELGYVRFDVAQDAGTFAVRGGIVDVFPASLPRPVRVELDFDEVVSVRWMDPLTQRSLEDVGGEIEVFARAEVVASGDLRSRAESALQRVAGRDYLEAAQDHLARLAEGLVPDGADALVPLLWDPSTDALASIATSGVVVLLDDRRVIDEADRAVEQEEELAALWADPSRLARDPGVQDLAPERVRVEDQVLFRPLELVLDELRVAGRRVWAMSGMQAGDGDDGRLVEGHPWPPALSPKSLLERCRQLLAEGFEVVVCAHAAEVGTVQTRLTEEELAQAAVAVSHLHGGFTVPTLRLAVVTHAEWHARASVAARPRRRTRPRALGELKPGDLVVHALHGIGRYVGMETREVGGFTREYLVCEYAGGDRLFVPSDTTEALTRYLGSEEPRLSRLGTGDWERTKARVRKKVRDIAADLIKLYSARASTRGYAYPSDSPWQRELEESFPFEETPDQLSAIHDVYRDMAREMPMDRLVCGDVGYGKTEVAVRAAFKAVTEGKQVAILVPTTLLAQQHFQTFTQRLEPFGVKIAMLSRFLSPAEQDRVIAKLVSGEVDVVVGTHRLLGKDTAFRDLGLLIVDEEHRFGVSQKERLKRMRVEVDVLTMTATPIPRTLEMSMSGIRDLSVIETAPAARRPIRTFVGPFEERIIAASIRRELARGGQVFYVHNRVQTIGREARRLERLIPEARVKVAHGQMDEDTLERTMLDFWARDIDVLICTTIIEAGLDIPTVNTLVVDHADKLGLAQLYQLRGRVGRAGEQAYAYLFYPSNVRLSETAHERLKTLATYTELGSGMAIALKDLEIRGSGNLLGAEQHGHIEAVGFEMYVRMLEEATRELKGEEPDTVPEVRLDLPIDAYLPSTYIDREPLRLAAYRRIAETVTLPDVQDAEAELRDRFGPLPDPARALLAVAELRAALRPLAVREVTVAPHELHGRVAKVRPVDLRDEWRAMRLRRKYPRAVISQATATLILPIPDIEGVELAEWLVRTLRGLLERDIVPA